MGYKKREAEKRRCNPKGNNGRMAIGSGMTADHLGSPHG